jgi:hypothetical protein
VFVDKGFCLLEKSLFVLFLFVCLFVCLKKLSALLSQSFHRSLFSHIAAVRNFILFSVRFRGVVLCMVNRKGCGSCNHGQPNDESSDESVPAGIPWIEALD